MAAYREAGLPGPVIGPLGYEVLGAFFLEAGFLGIMLFGTERVGRGPHFPVTCIVAFGTLFSAFWILSVNSWMQRPAGYAVAPDGRFMPTCWLHVSSASMAVAVMAGKASENEHTGEAFRLMNMLLGPTHSRACDRLRMILPAPLRPSQVYAAVKRLVVVASPQVPHHSPCERSSGSRLLFPKLTASS